MLGNQSNIGILFLLVICLCLVSRNVSGQNVIVKEKTKFRYQSHLYTYSELKGVFIKSEPANKEYKKYKSSNLKSKIFGYSSLGLIGAGIYYGKITDDGSCSSGGVCDNNITGLLLGISAILPGTLAIVYKLKAGKYKRKSITTFNNEIYQEGIILELKGTSNGIGILVNF